MQHKCIFSIQDRQRLNILVCCSKDRNNMFLTNTNSFLIFMGEGELIDYKGLEQFGMISGLKSRKEWELRPGPIFKQHIQGCS